MSHPSKKSSSCCAPVLVALAGLPGTGKTTLGRLLASRLGAAYLRLDTIEQALREVCAMQVAGEGYRISYRIAADNLRLGLCVVADCVNPWELTRHEWALAAAGAGAAFFGVELFCADQAEHENRVKTRASDVPGLTLPNWDAVRERDYQPWHAADLRVDTSGRSPETCSGEILAALSARGLL